VRIDKVYPIKDVQQMITDIQFSTIDPNTEKRVTDEIEKWNEFDKSVETDLVKLKTGQKVMEQTMEAQTRELAETRKRTSENREGLETANAKIAKLENESTALHNYPQCLQGEKHGVFRVFEVYASVRVCFLSFLQMPISLMSQPSFLLYFLFYFNSRKSICTVKRVTFYT
jgi:hypothetical protein